VAKPKELKMKQYKNLKAKVISPRSKSISGKQEKGTRMADKIERDLEKRRVQNRKRIDFERALERFVLDLKVDWAEFHEQLSQALDHMVCNHHTACRRILTDMGLNGELIDACLSFLPLQGGGCDCEVVLNVDMTNPKPLVDFSCADCGHDYDEYYMVRNDIWKTRGVGSSELCVGCLEKRIGRKLNEQDFTDSPVNDIDFVTKSLRLRDRLTTPPPGCARKATSRGTRPENHNCVDCGDNTMPGFPTQIEAEQIVAEQRAAGIKKWSRAAPRPRRRPTSSTTTSGRRRHDGRVGRGRTLH